MMKKRFETVCVLMYMCNKWTEEECDMLFDPEVYHKGIWHLWCECNEKYLGNFGAICAFILHLNDRPYDLKKIIDRAKEIYRDYE